MRSLRFLTDNVFYPHSCLRAKNRWDEMRKGVNFFNKLVGNNLDESFLKKGDYRLNLPKRVGVDPKYYSYGPFDPKILYYLGCNDFIIDTSKNLEEAVTTLHLADDFQRRLKRDGKNGLRNIANIRGAENNAGFKYNGLALESLGLFTNLYELDFEFLNRGDDNVSGVLEDNLSFISRQKNPGEGLIVNLGDISRNDNKTLEEMVEVGRKYGIGGVVIKDNESCFKGETKSEGIKTSIERVDKMLGDGSGVDIYVGGIRSFEYARGVLSVLDDGIRSADGVRMMTYNPKVYTKLNRLYR